MPRKYRFVMVLLAAVLLYTLHLGHRDIANSFESRAATTAKAMAEAGWPWNAKPLILSQTAVAHRGAQPSPAASAEPSQLAVVHPWMVPLYQGAVRLEKPPMPYWAAAICFRLFGQTEFAARIVPATLGLLAAAIFYDLSRRLLGRSAGWLATIAYLSMYFLPQEYRKIMADPFLAFATILTLWAWVRAAQSTGRGRSAWVWLAYLGLAFGAVSKGPVVFVHTGIAVAAFSWCYRRRIPGGWGVHVAGGASFLAASLAWPAYTIQHVQGAVELWRYESVGQLKDNTYNARPFWFYWPDLFMLAMPWTPLWLAGIVDVVRRWRRRRAFAAIWLLATVMFFSLPHAKKDAYLLPAVPAMALIVGHVLRRVLAASRRREAIQQFKVAATGQMLIAAIGAAGIAWLLRDRPLLGLAAIGAALTLPLLIRRPTQWAVATAGAYAALVLLYVGPVATARENRDSPKRFCTEVVRVQQSTGMPVWRGALSESALYYLPSSIPLSTHPQNALGMIPPRRKKASEADTPRFTVPLPAEVTAERVAIDPHRANGWKLYMLVPQRAPSAGTAW